MRVHLIRHGEVENPDHVVYADLPGFTLSELGQRQAAAAADRLSSAGLAAVVSSPLERATATAAKIAARGGGQVEVDQRLTEWLLSSRWAGVNWETLPSVFPGELEAYLAHPFQMEFSPEPLSELAARVATAIVEWSAASPTREVAFVSHQDPIHAARRLLTGGGFADYHIDKPEHCSISTLEHNGNEWAFTDYWVPSQ